MVRDEDTPEASFGLQLFQFLAQIRRRYVAEFEKRRTNECSNRYPFAIQTSILTEISNRCVGMDHSSANVSRIQWVDVELKASAELRHSGKAPSPITLRPHTHNRHKSCFLRKPRE